MAGTPHTHEPPDDIVYVHAAWPISRLAKHLAEEHGLENVEAMNPIRRQLRHAEAHAVTLSTEAQERIAGQQLVVRVSRLLRSLGGRVEEIEHVVLSDAFGDYEAVLTTLNNVEKWLVDLAMRFEAGEETL